MTKKDAAMFPIIASGALFSMYIVFKLFSKEYINLLLTGYFFFLGVLALTHLLRWVSVVFVVLVFIREFCFSPVVSKLVPAAIPNIPFHILFRRGEGETLADIINYKFSSYDMVALFCCSLVGAWYLIQKHWVANNLFGLAFAVNAVELLHLNNVVTGCILLSGLFIYDIFWVFGTDVMVTVAKSFEAPIKRKNFPIEKFVFKLLLFSCLPPRSSDARTSGQQFCDARFRGHRHSGHLYCAVVAFR